MPYLPQPLPEHRSVGGIDCELLIRGKGKTLLFLHGGEGLDPTAPFIDALEHRFNVYAASHPGFGATALPDHFSRVDDLVFFYLDLIDDLGLDDIVLVGASFGGWIAAELAVLGNDRFSHLVLADSVGIRVGDRKQRDVVDIHNIPAAELTQRQFADPSHGTYDYPTLTDETLTRLMRNRESLTLFTWSPYMHNPKLRPRLSRVRIPTLLLWGAEDRFVSPDYGRTFADSIKGARFELIDGAGHYPHIERPVDFARRISDFVGEARKSS